jgi:hypothetical protein
MAGAPMTYVPHTRCVVRATQLDVAGWEASVNNVALDVEVGWAPVAGG